MRTIAVEPGRGVEGISIVLRPAGALHGRILDSAGKGLADALVAARRIGDQSHNRALLVDGIVSADPTSGAKGVRTNRDGFFTLRTLPPGTYVVSAASDVAKNQAVASALGHLYGRTYFANAVTDISARQIVVEPGGDQYLEWPLREVPAVKLQGNVVMSNGKAASGAVVRITGKQHFGSEATSVGAVFADSRGAFAIAVPPSRWYTLVASTGRPWERPGVQRDIEAVTLTIEHRGRALTQLTLRTKPGAVVRGKIIGTAGGLAQVRVFPSPSGPMSFSTQGSAAVGDDGTFELHNVFGCQTLHVGAADGILVVETSYLDDRALPNAEICVKDSEQVSGVRLAVRRPTAEVVGVVQSRSGLSVANSVIVLFPVDETKWSDPLGHYIHVTRADDAGRYRLRQVIAGSYYLVAKRRLRLADAYTADQLARLRAFAVRVEVDNDGHAAAGLELMEMEATDTNQDPHDSPAYRARLIPVVPSGRGAR